MGWAERLGSLGNCGNLGTNDLCAFVVDRIWHLPVVGVEWN